MYTYLFAKWESGCLIHQPILHGKTPPDGYVAKVTMNQPSQPMLVYDFKKEDFKTAVNESLGYCQVIFTQLKDFILIFVMPCSKTVLSLSLCSTLPCHHQYL